MAELITATGRRTFYDVTGAGPPLLLLMGAGESRRLWAWHVPAFAPTFRVITLDNRDSGESGAEPGPYTVADLAGDAVALLDALGLERAHVLGTSMGGMIAVQLALDHPARIDRLVLLSTPLGGVRLSAPPREGWPTDPAERMRGLFPLLAAPGYFDAHPAGLEELAEQGRANNLTYAGAVRHLEVMGRFDVRGRLAEVAVPTLVVVGDRDPLIPVADAQAWADTLPTAQLVVVTGAGHLAFLEQAEVVNRAVVAFLMGEQGAP